jgi:hypothetical protein
VGFVVYKVAPEQVFSEYFDFPCQFSFHRRLQTHHLLSGADTIRQIVADVTSGLIITPPKKLRKTELEDYWVSILDRRNNASLRQHAQNGTPDHPDFYPMDTGCILGLG